MGRRLRTAGFAALLLAAAAFAFGPLVSAPFSGEDIPFLVRASPAAGGDASLAANRLAASDGPLARFSLAVSCRLWTRDGRWSEAAARMVRIENLLLLLGTAAFTRLALRRALAPWAGMDGARAAAGASAVLVACHPLCVPAVAVAGARGDLLAACLGAVAAALFLRGRQEKRVPELVGAGACVVLAGHASSVGLLLAPLFFVLELFSARQHRPLHARLRTGATTFLVFGACSALEALTGPALGSPSFLPGFLARTWSTLTAAFASRGAGVELRSLAAGLGAVVFPMAHVAPPSSAALGNALPIFYVLSGALLLAALQPALVAARSAPRLWGWLAAAAGSGILGALLLGGSEALFPATLAACASLAVTSTALSGLRRVLVPAALAVSFALLARTASASILRESAVLGELQASLGSARSVHGAGSAYLVVDPPGREAGLDDAGETIRMLLDPSVCARSESGDSPNVRGISEEALLVLSREPEFAEMRRRTVVLLSAPDAPGLPRVVSVLPQPLGSSGVLSWQGDLRSPLFDVDPLERRALRAVALPTATTADAPHMGWRAGKSATFARTGVWIEGPDGPVALFDLSGSRLWLFGPRAHRAWLEPDVGRIASAQLLVDVPAIPGKIEPDVRSGSGRSESEGSESGRPESARSESLRSDPGLPGSSRPDAWVFTIDPGALPRPLHGEARFVLGLLDLESFRYLEFDSPARPDGAQAAEVVFEVPPSSDSPRAWSLDLRCGDVCIARASGRR